MQRGLQHPTCTPNMHVVEIDVEPGAYVQRPAARYPTRRGIPRGTVPPRGTARTCIRQQHVRLVDGRRNGRFRRGAHALDILRSGVRASGQDEAALRRIHRTSAHRKAGAVDTAAAKAWTSGGEKAAAGGGDEISRYG
jgi:hypothetical protein